MSSARSALEIFLRRLRLRSILSDEESAAILSLEDCSEPRAVHGDFVEPGMPVQHACLVVEGLVGRYAQLANGSRQIVALHIPGDMSDLLSVVAPKVTWALRAMTPSEILRVPHRGLLELVHRYPAIGLAFWRDCMVDANILAQWTVNIARRDAGARLAHLFCEMAIRYSSIGANRDHYAFPINQADLADTTGLTSVHLNRMLQRFKDTEVVRKSRTQVTIQKWDELVAIADFEDDYLQLEQDDRG